MVQVLDSAMEKYSGGYEPGGRGGGVTKIVGKHVLGKHLLYSQSGTEPSVCMMP